MSETKTRGRKGRIVLTVCVAVLLVALVILKQTHGSPENNGAAPSEETSQAPRLAVRSTPWKPPSPLPMPPKPEQERNPVVDSPARPPAPRSYQEAARLRQMSRLDEQWQAEQKRSDWTSSVRANLLDEFQRREIVGTLNQLDCRMSLCKMEIGFDGPTEAARINAIEHDVNSGWYADFRITEGGRVMVTAYLGAPGASLREIIDDPVLR